MQKAGTASTTWGMMRGATILGATILGATLLAMAAALTACQMTYENVRVVAGTGEAGYVDAQGTDAVLNRPHGLAQSTSGKIYFADRGNHMIRAIDPKTREVTTIAGSGERGFADGNSAEAMFNQPVAVAVGADGRVYVADRDNHRIRAIAADGSVTTLAGDGTAGYLDATASAARFHEPYGVVLDESGQNLFVADYLNHAIRKVNLASGVVTTVAGNGEIGFQDGVGAAARFHQPYNITRGDDGAFYIPDQKNHAIRKLLRSGEVITVAGSGEQGYRDGVGRRALFNNPTGLAVIAGVIYVCDRNNHRIRRIDEGGNVSTLAGTGTDGAHDGPAIAAEFSKPLDLIVENESKALVISEDTGHRLRVVW